MCSGYMLRCVGGLLPVLEGLGDVPLGGAGAPTPNVVVAADDAPVLSSVIPWTEAVTVDPMW